MFWNLTAIASIFAIIFEQLRMCRPVIRRLRIGQHRVDCRPSRQRPPTARLRRKRSSAELDLAGKSARGVLKKLKS